jgi:hypothetical protein
VLFYSKIFCFVMCFISQLLVFTKVIPDHIYVPLTSDAEIQIEKAYDKADAVFRAANLLGGTHKLPIEATLDLIQLIQINPGDICWEIGCGSLQLAFALSNSSNGGPVIATDLGE